jgi:hypothetical protein
MQFEEANSTMHHVNSSCIPSSKVTISNNDGVHCKTHHGRAASATICRGTRAALAGVWLRAMGARWCPWTTTDMQRWMVMISSLRAAPSAALSSHSCRHAHRLAVSTSGRWWVHCGHCGERAWGDATSNSSSADIKLATATIPGASFVPTVTPRITKTLIKVIIKWLGVNTIINPKVEFKN